MRTITVVEPMPGGAVVVDAGGRAALLEGPSAAAALDDATPADRAVAALLGPGDVLRPAPRDDPAGSTAWTTGPWTQIGQLLDRSSDAEGREFHRVHLLDDHRAWSAAGALDPAAVDRLARAATATAVARRVVAEVATLADGPVVVLKGVDHAELWPLPCLRPVGDVDLLVSDPAAVDDALRRRGWTPAAGPSAGGHHGVPLRHPDHGVLLELHDRPYWPAALRPGPSTVELVESATPATHLHGARALDPLDRVVLTAVHAWQQRPLNRMVDLVDVAAMRSSTGDDDITARARALGAGRLWELTRRALDDVLDGRPGPWPVRWWTRALPDLRARGDDGSRARAARAVGRLLVADPVTALRTTARDTLRTARDRHR